MYSGDYALGQTVDSKFTTRRFSTGAPFTLAGTPSVAAYPDNSTTEVTAGITLTVDFDSRTGLNNIRVVATSGNGYAAGSTYALVITAGTVDGVSVVGEVVGVFTLERGAAFGRLGAPAGASVSADIAAIQADTDNLQTRVPAALVSGRMDSSVGAMAANVLTATAINADAITAAKVADGTIDAATFAAGAINAAAIAADAITAAKIATNAIDADALATDAVTEIQAGLATSAALATVQADTDDIQTRLPAALVGGRMDSSVGAMAANTVTAAAIATDAIDSDAIAASAVTEIQAGLATAAALATVQADTDDIQTRLPAALVGGRMNSDAVAISGSTAAADAVEANIGNLDATVSSRATPAQVNAEVVDGLSVDTYAEPTGAPPAADTIANKLGRVHQVLRNKLVVNSGTGQLQLFDDAGVLLWSKALTDAAGVYTEAEGS